MTLDSSKIGAGLVPGVARCAPAGLDLGELQSAELRGDARGAVTRMETGGLELPEAAKKFAADSGVPVE